MVLSRAGVRVHAARKAAHRKALRAVVFVAGLKALPFHPGGRYVPSFVTTSKMPRLCGRKPSPREGGVSYIKAEIKMPP